MSNELEAVRTLFEEKHIELSAAVFKVCFEPWCAEVYFMMIHSNYFSI